MNWYKFELIDPLTQERVVVELPNIDDSECTADDWYEWNPDMEELEYRFWEGLTDYERFD